MAQKKLEVVAYQAAHANNDNVGEALREVLEALPEPLVTLDRDDTATFMALHLEGQDAPVKIYLNESAVIGLSRAYDRGRDFSVHIGSTDAYSIEVDLCITPDTLTTTVETFDLAHTICQRMVPGQAPGIWKLCKLAHNVRECYKGYVN